MPNYKGHLAGGLVVYLIIIYCIMAHYFVSFATGFEWLLFTLAGALFPDVDIKSKGQKLFYFIVLLLFIMLLYYGYTQGLILLGVISIVPVLVRHRGIFHRLWFVVAVPLLGALILCTYMPTCDRIIMIDALFFIIGAISHLWLDFGFLRMFRW
jgi:hypothetical protein